MADHARSDSPLVQAQLDRFAQLSPGRDILGLERITRLLELLGNPQNDLPPVFHVAGTNGKGSTCAFLRACLESAGHSVHVYSSPHLVRFNERFRVAGTLISDEALAPLLSEVLDAAEADQLGPSFFEATTAAAFLAFARTPADAAIIEVGLGGRLDATNIITHPLVCGIAQLGVDHQAFLGDDAVTIAGEKAGIAKAGVPLVTMAYPPAESARVAEVATTAGSPLHPQGSDWDAVVYQGKLGYRDEAGKLTTPLPRLPGGFQAMNAALAIAMLRHQSALDVPEAALRAGIGWAKWPARLQHLDAGPLVNLLPEGTDVWLDGCHNPAAAELVAAHMAQDSRPLSIICGILANKDAAGILQPFLPFTRSMRIVPVPGHEHHDPQSLAAWAKAQGVADAEAAADLPVAFSSLQAPERLLIMGSLYLAAEALRLNDQVPD